MSGKFKAKTYEPGKSPQLLHAHLKRDGIWLEIGQDESSSCYAITSKPSDVYAAVHAYLPRLWAGLNPGDRVYGELWVPDHPASAVKSVLAGNMPGVELRFDAFAAITEGLRADSPLLGVESWCREAGLPFAPYELVDYSDPIIAANPAAYYHGLFSTRYGDCEGVVLKDANLFNWYKWKPVKTIDVVITDFTEGDGKYLGYIGSLKVSVYDERGSLIEIANVSGMTDLERDEITDLATNGGLLGRVCEVKYQYVGSGGRLRHPRFKCWREDKPAGECKTSQDPELIAYLSADEVIT